MKQSQQIVQVLRSTAALPPDVYHASLSSLAKAILLQAETEVTAEKRSARPLARLTLNSMNLLEGFGTVFWAKLCQRTGGWAIPAPVPSKDADGTPFTPATRTKASGLREEETSADHTARVAGIMRVYFSLLLLPPPAPLSREFHMSRLWTFVSRLVGQPALLHSSLATELLSGMSSSKRWHLCHLVLSFLVLAITVFFYLFNFILLSFFFFFFSNRSMELTETLFAVALEVGGSHARDIWGSQWIKLMALLYKGVTTDPSPLGGSGLEARASRVRLQLEIERVMGSG
jgi:nucleoporin GLE1